MATSKATTVESYLGELPVDRRRDIERVRMLVRRALPRGQDDLALDVIEGAL